VIPTLRSVDHVAFTVPDLDAAVTFLVDHLGGELVFTDGPFADPDGDSIARRLDVDAKASCVLAMVRVGRINVELFAYDAPGQSATPDGTPDRHVDHRVARRGGGVGMTRTLSLFGGWLGHSPSQVAAWTRDLLD